MKNVKMHVGLTGSTSWIEVDGERVSNIKSVDLKVAAGETTQLVVAFLPSDMEIEIEDDVWTQSLLGSLKGEFAKKLPHEDLRDGHKPEPQPIRR